MARLSYELDEDSNDHTTNYYIADNWKWYIFCSERKIDAQKIPEIKLPPIDEDKLNEIEID